MHKSEPLKKANTIDFVKVKSTTNKMMSTININGTEIIHTKMNIEKTTKLDYVKNLFSNSIGPVVTKSGKIF